MNKRGRMDEWCSMSRWVMGTSVGCGVLSEAASVEAGLCSARGRVCAEASPQFSA